MCFNILFQILDLRIPKVLTTVDENIEFLKSITTLKYLDVFRYVYTDEINLTTIEQACELCYAAKKYMLPCLVNQCMSFIWKDVTYPMAFRAYEFAKLFDEPDLMRRCLEVCLHLHDLCCHETGLVIRGAQRGAGGAQRAIKTKFGGDLWMSERRER